MRDFNIKEELKKLPDKPGVYIMHDADDKIIYVGKAVVLKNRVRQYFQKGTNHSNKTKRMVSQINWFEYIVTASEAEALVLECNLIKHNRPKYNILLKDDKSYPYIKITNERFPRIFFTRHIYKDGGKYFGPYTNVFVAKQMLHFLKRIYPLRQCTKILPCDTKNNRPCLNYHIGRCLAPCDGKVSEEEYNEMIKEVASFLEGKHEQLTSKLQAEMKKYSDNMEYEKAANVRDKLNTINEFMQKQKVTEPNADKKDIDIISWLFVNKKMCLQVFFMRNGKIIGRENFIFNDVDSEDEIDTIMGFLKQFYLPEDRFIPNEVVIKCCSDEADLLSQWLSGRKGRNVKITIPQKGEKKKLLDMVDENVNIELVKREGNNKLTLGALADLIEYDDEINRIEAYDISNLRNDFMVGCMIVFDENGFEKAEYRKFKIKTVMHQSDVDCLREVISRRFNHNDIMLPEIILLDGGKNQMNACIDIIRDKTPNTRVIGMYKDDKHRTKGLLLEDDTKIELKDVPEIFKLVTKIQDEVHRFTIGYNKQLRSKALNKSILDDIEGVGEKRKQALIKHFGSVQKIKEATEEEIAKIVGKTVAKNIKRSGKNFF